MGVQFISGKEWWFDKINAHNIVFVLIVLSLFLLGLEWFINNFKSGYDIFDDVEHLYEGSLIILTIFLVCVAWVQLNRISNTSKADFLLRIDARWGNKEIVDARTIIQEFYANTRSKDISREVHIQRIADKIKHLGQSKRKADVIKFVLLLNFLDFLETIAFFCNKDYISVDEVNDLAGNSILYFFNIFRQWIYYRQAKYDPSFYSELIKLVQKIENRNHEQLFHKE